MTSQTVSISVDLPDRIGDHAKISARGDLGAAKRNKQLVTTCLAAYYARSNSDFYSLGCLSTAGEYRGDNAAQTYLINYDYDLFGNRYQKQTHNSSNPFSPVWVEDVDVSQLTNRLTSGLTYDAAGNVLSDTKFRQLQFLYDANNRQRWSANLDGSAAVTAVYDGAGQRVATKINGTLSVNVYDAFGKLVAEYGQTAGTGGTQYIFSDQQGTPRVVTNQSGSVLSRHDYQPFGEELAGTIGMRAGTPGYSGADGVKQKYAGMEGDDTGLSHTLWRQYDTKSGRWTGPDPYSGSMTIGDPQSFNRYTYVNNDPVNKVDPLGLRLIDIGVVQTEDPEEAWTLERKSMNEAGSDMATGRAVDNWNAGNGWKATLDEGGGEAATDESHAPAGETQNSPTATIMPGATPEQEARIQAGFELAENLIKTVPTCSAFFGGAQKALSTLDFDTAYKVDSSLDPTGSGHPQAASEIGSTYVHLNPKGGVFAAKEASFDVVAPGGKLSQSSKITLSGNEAAAFVFLHETAHKTHPNRFGSTDKDFGKGDKYLLRGFQNNWKIWQACFPNVKAAH